MTLATDARRTPQFEFRHRLVLAREVAGMQQSDIAEVLDVKRQTISNYERGVSSPNRLQINAWAVACGVDVEWLKTGREQEETGPEGGAALRPVGPTGLEPMTSTVEYGRLAEVLPFERPLAA